MGDSTVTIACPVRNRQGYLPSYLENILKVDYDKQLINLYFLINNSTDDSESILNKFKLDNLHKYNEITIERFVKNKNIPQDQRSLEVRLNHIYSHLADLRNFIFLKVETDYLLSCDSDIMMPANIIKKLLHPKFDICAGVIFNGYLINHDEPWRYSNILTINKDMSLEHVSNYWVKNSPSLTESKYLGIGVTGAVCMMSKDVCKNTKYGFHKEGEDVYWSIDCLSKGYKIYCDTSVYCSHLMNEKMLEEYLINNRNNT